MIDVLDAIRDFLVSRPNVAVLVGNRVYAGRAVPPVGYKPSDGQAIAFNVRGGNMSYDDDHIVASAQFKCYGSTELLANQLYHTLVDDVHNKHDSTVRWAILEILGHTLEEPDTEWPYVLTYFTFVVRQGGN